MTTLTFGYSPCPNDTFIFGGLATGRIKPAGFDLSIELHDVETLNHMALAGTLDISKLSFHAWLKVKSNYRLLPCGAALGYGCGPIVVARHPMTKAEVVGSRIVIPGSLTTAHLLFRLWAPDAHRRSFVPYDQIFKLLQTGQADCGVIIHESRFTYEQAGLVALVDLGAFWEAETGAPIPLGCIAAKSELGDDILKEIEENIRASLRFANTHPQENLPYIQQYAQEMDPHVLGQHIKTFVNEFSMDLGPEGHKALEILEERARQAGVLQ